VARDPYTVLGVGRDADAAAIKKAYRKLAKQHHPDLKPGDSKNAERFKEISAAYGIVGDAEQRARFDRGEIDANGNPRQPEFTARGGGPFRGGGGGFEHGGRPEDIFADLFSGFGGFGAGPRRTARAPQPGADRHYRLTVDFIDAVRGESPRLTLVNGKTLAVKLPAGAASGQTIRLKGQGDPSPNNGPNGDAIVEIDIAPHPHFSREGDDVLLTLPVSVGEALQGASVEVPTIDGPVSLKVPKGANSGTKLRLKGRGAVTASGRGNQVVTLQVMLPEQPDEALMKWAAGNPYAVKRPR
jgi:DnaJ-class molecular chaperone